MWIGAAVEAAAAPLSIKALWTLGMDRLANLRKELSTMSHDEVLDFIRKTRTDRRITKERPAARRTRRVKGEQAKTKALRAVEGMSSDQIAALISQLEGEQENEDSGAAN